MSRAAITDLYRIDDMLSAEERAIRDTVARFIDKEYLPIVGKHFRNGTFPTELIPQLADMGVFGATSTSLRCMRWSNRTGANSMCSTVRSLPRLGIDR